MQKKLQKILKNIILGLFFWNTGIRHAIRFGKLKNYFKFRKHFYKNFEKENKGPFQYNLAIVLIIKDEAKYLPEWIEFHKLVGVNHFYVYDNESTDNIKEILKSYIKSGDVSYKFWPGKLQQVPAYEDAIKTARLQTKWLAFIDIDEFIVPLSKKTISEVIREINPKYGLGMHWLHYGSNGHKNETNDLVIERFNKHGDITKNPFYLLKTILNPRAVYSATPHHGLFIGNRSSTNELGEKVAGNSKNISINKIRVNHYFCKSLEEFQQKNKRGDAMENNGIYDKNFSKRDNNDIQDTEMKKYIPAIKKELKEKNENIQNHKI